MAEHIVLSKWKCFVREYFLILWVSEQLFLTFLFGTFSFHFSNVQIFHSSTVKMFLWYIILQCFITMKYIWMVAKKNILVASLQCFPIHTFKTFHYIKLLKSCIFLVQFETKTVKFKNLSAQPKKCFDCNSNEAIK